jgi:phosphoglycerol transferase
MKYGDGSNKMLNAIHCADFLAAGFIRRILASPYARDTVLVVGSDHFVLSSDATEMVQAPGGELPRNNLLMVFDSDQPARIVSRNGTTLDIAPTILDIMGYQTGHFAIGRNLLAKDQTLVEKYGFEVFANKLEHWRRALWKYSNSPRQNQKTNKAVASLSDS